MLLHQNIKCIFVLHNTIQVVITVISKICQPKELLKLYFEILSNAKVSL